MKYEIAGFAKVSEQDNFEQGILLGRQEYWIDYPIAKDTKEEFISAVKYFLGDNIEIDFNACDEQGRIDIQVTENDDGCTPSATEWDEFKAGEIDLWAVTYTAYCESVTRTPVVF